MLLTVVPVKRPGLHRADLNHGYHAKSYHVLTASVLSDCLAFANTVLYGSPPHRLSALLYCSSASDTGFCCFSVLWISIAHTWAFPMVSHVLFSQPGITRAPLTTVTYESPLAMHSIKKGSPPRALRSRALKGLMFFLGPWVLQACK